MIRDSRPLVEVVDIPKLGLGILGVFCITALLKLSVHYIYTAYVL